MFSKLVRRNLFPWTAAALLVIALAMLARQAERAHATDRSTHPEAPRYAGANPGSGETWRDSFGDGWPDSARLSSVADRVNFARWFTYVAESLYYQPGPRTRDEVQDCAALIRYAFRSALTAHTPEWRRTLALRVEPGFAGLAAFHYPNWPLGRNLFRTGPGPFASVDLASGMFREFADAKTLLEFNTFPVSRDLGGARAGDLLFFLQPEQAEPFHAMLFVGHSHFQPQGNDWIVYHTGDVNGHAGAIRHVQASVLAGHPEPRWRPLAANPHFLGVYRFNLLR